MTMAGSSPGPQEPPAAERVREMFSGIAGRYDLLNSLLSLGRDRSWRREAAAEALAGGPAAVLDAATGTGELALTLKRARPEARVVGVDFSGEMLRRAGEKASSRGFSVEFERADVLDLPFADETFDAVTIAYGLRNLTDRGGGLAELRRVLRPGGRMVVLEFPPPPDNLFGSIFRFYFLNVLPKVGGWLSGDAAAYTYLPNSVLAFPRPPELAALLVEAGFEGVRYRLQSLGVSAIFVGEKKS